MQSAGGQVLSKLSQWAALAILLLVCHQATAQSEHQVYFAGHGFDAQCDQIETKFQHLSAFLGQTCGGTDMSERTQQFAALILGKLPASSRKLDVVTDGLGSLGAGNNARVLALVFDGEMVAHQRIGGVTADPMLATGERPRQERRLDTGSSAQLEYLSNQRSRSGAMSGASYKVLVEVTAQVVVFDFNSMTIVWSKPLAGRMIHAAPSRPGKQDIESALEHILSGLGEHSLPIQFARSLAEYDPAQSSGLRLGVEKVSVAPGIWKPGYPAGIEDHLASRFSRNLSGDLGVSVVPPAKTDAIDNRMAARMADGAVYALAVPESDYPVRIHLDNLVKVEFDRTHAEVSNVVGAYVTFDVGVRAGSDDRIKSVFSEQIKIGVSQVHAVNTVFSQASDGFAYYEVIEQLFDSFAGAVESPNRKWASSHVVSTKNARKAVAKLNELREVIERCR